MPFSAPDWDHQLMEIYTSGTGEHVLQSRGLGAIFGSSMYSGTPLKDLVDRYATDALIEAIALEAHKGRLTAGGDHRREYRRAGRLGTSVQSP